ncbi:MAG: putative porin [Bdellovibrionota bacterium]
MHLIAFISFTVLTISVQAQVSATVVNDAPTAMVSETAILAPEKVEFIPSNKLSGDFRYRHQELKDNQKEKRRVHRIMLRLGQTFSIQPDLKFTYRLMTGSSANSGNTSFGDKSANTQGSPRYGIGLDQAFATYNLETELTLFIGKMPQLFQTAGKNQIILDRDITPEGIAAQYKYVFIEKKLGATFNLASLWVRERYDDSFGEDQSDSFLNVAQIVVDYKMPYDLSATLGYGLYSYTNIKDSKPTDIAVQSTADFKGNTADVLSNYLYNYEVSQKILELKWSKKPYEVSVFAELIENTAAPTQNKGRATGLNLAYDKFNLTYINQVIEADSVLATYTNSDFANGQTDSRGNILQLGYKMNKNAALSYSVYSSERAASTFPVKHVLSQLDLTISF